jgi:hypothetical protein
MNMIFLSIIKGKLILNDLFSFVTFALMTTLLLMFFYYAFINKNIEGE